MIRSHGLRTCVEAFSAMKDFLDWLPFLIIIAKKARISSFVGNFILFLNICIYLSLNSFCFVIQIDFVGKFGADLYK